jgi:CcmD family protein
MRKLTTLLSLALPALGWAQQENTMYSEGKIYVVIAVIGIIFVGLAAYLFQLDRKITKIENEK